MSQAAPAPESIRTLAIRSSFVNLAASFGLKGLTLAQAVIYARVFVPGELGQVATVLLVISFMTVITRMGFEESIVRENDHPERVMQTAFFLALVLGAILSAGLYVAAPLVASAFHRAELTQYLRFMAFMVFGSALGLPNALWAQRFRFGLAKVASFADLIVGTVVTLVLHFHAGLGIWSLLWGRIAGFAANYLTVWIIAAYRPWPVFDRAQARVLLSFGWPIVVGSLANYLMHQGDAVIVRYFHGDATLAYYQLAYAFPYYLMEGTDVLLGALLPTFSRLRDSRERLVSAFVQSNKYITLAIVPCGIALAALAGPLVRVVFGAKWLPAVGPMTVLAIGFTVQVMWGYGWGALVLASGRTRYLMYVKLWIVVYLLTAGTLLIRAFGAMGGALYVLTQAILTVGVVRGWILQHELGSRSFIKDSWKPVVASLVPGALVWWLASPHIGSVVGLIFTGIAYGAVYIGLMSVFDRELVPELRHMARLVFGPRAA
ncbi:MAG TPA: oligosaccharide flippase family protein [Candidatus Eisenbacteria bacterium]|nr:oligosaccharide flippase family protein [Candidatus Eisenbacteria bacterium]